MVRHRRRGERQLLRGLQLALCADHPGAPLPLRLGLPRHRPLHRLRQRHVLDLDTVDVYAPAQRRTVDHQLEALVEPLAVGQQVVELTYGLLRPIPWSLLSQSLSPREAAIPNLPVSYLVGAQDLSLPEGEEWWATKYAPRLGVEPIAFDGCHSAYFTTPTVLAETLMTVAQGGQEPVP
jgi:hypothetical protein